MNDNNNTNDRIEYEAIRNLTSSILSLSPFEFTTIATLLGYIISLSLTTTEQNSVGNWFELVGQVILTFNAQGSVNLPPSPKQFIDLQKQVESLQDAINRIKKSE